MQEDLKTRLKLGINRKQNLSFPPQTFDCIISIDTLHFVEDLNKTITKMKQLLKPNGQMGIFYAQRVPYVQEWDLAKILTHYGLNYQCWDFTEKHLTLEYLINKLLKN